MRVEGWRKREMEGVNKEMEGTKQEEEDRKAWRVERTRKSGGKRRNDIGVGCL